MALGYALKHAFQGKIKRDKSNPGQNKLACYVRLKITKTGKERFREITGLSGEDIVG